MIELVKKIKDRIEKMESERQRIADEVRGMEKIMPEFLESKFVKAIEPKEFSGKVAAVDGGILDRSYYGIDVYVVRSAGVIYDYERGELKRVEYVPSRNPEHKVIDKYELDENESRWAKSIIRLKEEVSRAAEINADIVIMDGSIFPLPSDIPAKDSQVYPEYEELAGAYKGMFKGMKRKGALLLGISKDSRSAKMAGKFKIRGSDVLFADKLLKAGERSAVMEMKWPNENEKGYFMYVKVSEEDMPLRVEFLEHRMSFDEIAGIVHWLSGINKKYTYPAVLIEADLTARLHEVEIERIEREIMFGTGSLRKFRRERRPFGGS
ncbi:MAG: DNA double-strand break repair nuclease NurA [Candidatus Anstonellales archaeon]